MDTLRSLYNSTVKTCSTQNFCKSLQKPFEFSVIFIHIFEVLLEYIKKLEWILSNSVMKTHIILHDTFVNPSKKSLIFQ